MKEKTRYSDSELGEFRELIKGKIVKAKEELEFYHSQLRDRAENSDSKLKGLDDAGSSAEAERLTQLAGRQEKYIKHLENALIRIQNKVYGICRTTNKLINKDRLRAVPHATLSMDAKMSKGGRRRRR